ncbi:MAG: hypothetical protein ACREP9_08015 [Candidatus Dormibacteraceae bacterium]
MLQIDADIKLWEARLADRPESHQLSYARRELGFAVYAASAGLYGSAFASLRLFLELSFAAVYFSANEFNRRQWASGRRDFSWSAALDENNGVLSQSFVREFNESAVPEVTYYAVDALCAYRDCSEFMHGKITSTRFLPETLSFSATALEKWARLAIRSAESVLFLLYCRYGDELLNGDDDGSLSCTLEHSFSHLVSVRKLLGLPLDHEDVKDAR